MKRISKLQMTFIERADSSMVEPSAHNRTVAGSIPARHTLAS